MWMTGTGCLNFPRIILIPRPIIRIIRTFLKDIMGRGFIHRKIPINPIGISTTARTGRLFSNVRDGPLRLSRDPDHRELHDSNLNAHYFQLIRRERVAVPCCNSLEV